MLQPGFRSATPFGLSAGDQFRPPPPPPLHSSAYATAYNEVIDHGRVDSAVRTSEQTDYAVWWMEFTEGSMNRLARNLVTEHGTHLWEAARLFTLLNMSMFDTYVATWNSKFAENHWRPVHRDPCRSRRREPEHRARRDLATTSPHTAVPRVCVGPQRRMRQLVRDPRSDVRASRRFQHGHDDRAPGYADTIVRDVPASRRGVRRLTGTARMALPLRNRRWPRSRTSRRHLRRSAPPGTPHERALMAAVSDAPMGSPKRS